MQTLMVANAGGHMAELIALAPAFDPAETARWVTNDTSQTRSLLDGRSVSWATYSGARDLVSLTRHMRLANRSMAGVEHVVSTGASLAPPFFLAARARGIRCTYVESATRLAAPSLSGRLAAAIPGVELFSQTRQGFPRRWRYGGCVWDGWEACDRTPSDATRTRVLVTTGTARDYGFPAMVRAVASVVQADWEVVWQVGRDVGPDLPGRVVEQVPFEEMVELTDSADLIFSHAGAGSALLALEHGTRPVLFPRLASRGEHVDDHQRELARALADRDLAEVVDASDGIDSGVVARALRRGVRRRPLEEISWQFGTAR